MTNGMTTGMTIIANINNIIFVTSLFYANASCFNSLAGI